MLCKEAKSRGLDQGGGSDGPKFYSSLKPNCFIGSWDFSLQLSFPSVKCSNSVGGCMANKLGNKSQSDTGSLEAGVRVDCLWWVGLFFSYRHAELEGWPLASLGRGAVAAAR